MEREYSVNDCLAYWAKNREVYVDANNVEQDWLHKKEGCSWKPLWIIEEFYMYTSRVLIEFSGIYTPKNFQSYRGGIDCDLAELIADVWFDEAERIGESLDVDTHRDNKTALKLRNRLTGEILYMGWYDGRLTVGAEVRSEYDPIKLLSD